MPLISDNFHNTKLKDFGINIKTKYIVGDKVFERNTDNSINDDIVAGIRCEKEYYIGKNLIHKEKEFDSRIEYTFISKEMESKECKCPNCGVQSKVENFIDGCPYCGTCYNIDYSDKDLGSKYHYDRVLRSNKYRIITGLFDLIFSLIICAIIIKFTSRTFNFIDISKIFVYGILLAAILYYFFYILDAYIILAPIKKYKDRQNQKQIEFWDRTKIDKKAFFNNLNYEMRKHYYAKNDVIDFDVLDYIEFDDCILNDNDCVKVKAEVRIVRYSLGKITSNISKEEYIMKKNNCGKLELNDGVNIIKCPNCGSSIDVIKGKCEYCNIEIQPLLDWYMV